MRRETPFLTYWRTICPALPMGEAFHAFAWRH